MGVLSILASLLIVVIPIGSSIIEIINIIVYILGLIFIIYWGLIRENKYLGLFCIIYLVILLILIGIIEMYYSNYDIVFVGFIIGLLLSIVGIVDSIRNRNKYKIKLIIIINIIAGIVSLISFGMILFYNNSFIIENKDECNYMTGGGYNILFDTNSDIVFNNMHVCIACPLDSYDDLPIPKRDNYEFLGWYYDKKLNNKVNVSSTRDINSVSDKDIKGCLVGYKDIKLYAKWSKIR